MTASGLRDHQVVMLKDQPVTATPDRALGCRDASTWGHDVGPHCQARALLSSPLRAEVTVSQIEVSKHAHWTDRIQT